MPFSAERRPQGKAPGLRKSLRKKYSAFSLFKTVSAAEAIGRGNGVRPSRRPGTASLLSAQAATAISPSPMT